MPIQSQNAVLNQYSPPFCIDRPVAGETFIYDPNKKTWMNKALSASDLGGVAPEGLVWQGGVYGPGDVVTISEDLTTFVSTPRSEFGGGEGGATKLNDLSDVAIVAPLDKQAFIYDPIAEKWVNEYIDYDSLSNVPNEFTPSPHFHVEADITDLDKYTQAEVDALIFSGDYNDLLNIPTEFNPAPHTHVKAEITDFNDADYATSDQGLLADTALQPGDNISLLLNDAGYITSSDTFSGSYNDLTDVPTEFNPAPHTHTKSEITDFNDADYATAEQGLLADSALQAGDNISLLVNDAGYITSSDTFSGDYNDLTNVPTEFNPAPHTHTKSEITDFNDADYATAEQGLLADSALQAGDNISLLVNDAGYITSSDTFSGDYNDLTNVPTEFNPAPHTHTKSEITDFNDADYATAEQGLLADSALQSGDNISELVNDAGYLTTGLQAGDNISLLTNDAGYIIDITAQSIGDLSDVDMTGAFNGAILTWNGSSFILDEKSFIKGTDTPSTYAGQAGKLLSVNSEENAVEFTDIIDGGAY